MLFYLIAGHFVCDYGLQTAYIAHAKGELLRQWRFKDSLVERIVPGYSGVKFEDWFWPLCAHCMMHGLAVAIITNNIIFGIGEVICHFMIDGVKGVTNMSATTDQLMHVGCKVLWWLFVIFAIQGTP